MRTGAGLSRTGWPGPADGILRRSLFPSSFKSFNHAAMKNLFVFLILFLCMRLPAQSPGENPRSQMSYTNGAVANTNFYNSAYSNIIILQMSLTNGPGALASTQFVQRAVAAAGSGTNGLACSFHPARPPALIITASGSAGPRRAGFPPER